MPSDSCPALNAGANRSRNARSAYRSNPAGVFRHSTTTRAPVSASRRSRCIFHARPTLITPSSSHTTTYVIANFGITRSLTDPPPSPHPPAAASQRHTRCTQ
jgi:hypothetical protein